MQVATCLLLLLSSTVISLSAAPVTREPLEPLNCDGDELQMFTVEIDAAGLKSCASNDTGNVCKDRMNSGKLQVFAKGEQPYILSPLTVYKSDTMPVINTDTFKIANDNKSVDLLRPGIYQVILQSVADLLPNRQDTIQCGVSVNDTLVIRGRSLSTETPLDCAAFGVLVLRPGDRLVMTLFRLTGNNGEKLRIYSARMQIVRLGSLLS